MFKSRFAQHGWGNLSGEANDLKGSNYMDENGTWDKRLLVRCSYHEAKKALNYARPDGGFTVLSTTCFLVAHELSLKFVL